MIIKTLKFRYITGLGSIAFFAIVFQFFIQWQLFEKRNDSFIIDTAGRQRMFSQKITKDILAIRSTDLDSKTDFKSSLKKSLATFEEVHSQLQTRPPGKFSGENSIEVQSLFAKINPIYAKLIASAQCYLEKDSVCSESLSNLLETEAKFLKLMNSIVASYSYDLEKSLAEIQKIEFFILFLTLLILFLEIFYIFKPAINMIEVSMDSLEKQQAIAEKNFKLATLGELSASLIHELKNPLHIMKGKCELLFMRVKRNDLTNEDLLKQVSGIMSSLDRTNDIISGVLNASREHENIDLVNFDLIKCINENLAFTKHLAEEKGVKIVTDFNNRAITAVGHISYMSQTLLNLISNALYAAEESSEKFIKIKAYSDQGFIYIEIENSGEAIKDELKNKIFTPFFTTKSKDGGTGLGLSVSKNLMRKMSGDLYLKESNQNTTFVVKIIKLKSKA